MRNPNINCIPLAAADLLQEAINKGEIDIAELYNMSHEARIEKFSTFASADLAKDITTSFEKAMVSKQKDAIKSWVEGNIDRSQKEAYQKTLDKVNEIAEVITDANFKGVADSVISESLGVNLSVAEVKTIVDKANNLQTLFEKRDADGVPSVEYFVARKEMDDYIASLTPTSELRVLSSTIRRGAMLTSLKSPIVNIESNIVNGLLQAFERRATSGTAGLNGDFASGYVRKAWDIYQKSGYDITRMVDMSANQHRLGEEITSSQGKGAIRAIGRWFEDVTFKQLMGAPDVASSAIAFSDSANLASTKMAKGNKELALKMFKDATRIDPLTLEGRIIREQAIADAQLATYTNNGGFSEFSMGIRNVLNNATGNVRLGDQLMPFVKTPANVVQLGIETAGAGLVKFAVKYPEAQRQLELGNDKPMRELSRLAVRSGIGMTFALFLANMLNPDDFIGEYEAVSPKGRDIAKATGAGYNSIKVGGKYISLDYLGPLASAFVGFMYARKYGKNMPDSFYQYGLGVASQATKIPGARNISDLYNSIADAVKSKDMKDAAGNLTSSGVDYVRSAVIPGIVSDIAKATDPYERDTSKRPLDKAIASIPALRTILDKKISQMTGESIKAQNPINTMLFGSRVKESVDNPVVNEIARLYNADNAPVVSDITRSSKRVKELHDQVGDDKFKEAIEYYGSNYGRIATKVISSSDYKKKPDDEKAKMLNDVRSDVLKNTLMHFGYRRPRDNKKAINK